MTASDYLSPQQFFAGSVSPGSLHPNQRTNPAAVDRLTESMQARGYDGKPIDVVHTGSALEVTDGHHRRAAAQNAGLPEVPVMGVATSGVPEGMREITRREYHQTLNPELARALYR